MTTASIENKVDSIINELQAMGKESTKKTLIKHGAREPFFGVKVEDLKKILKREKHNHELALALYDTGISDAMYLAGLMADGAKMSPDQINDWAEAAPWSMISEYTVPWVASENRAAFDLAMKWIDSGKDRIACSGWATLSMLPAVRPDSELDLKAYEKLIERVENTIHDSPNRVRYVMNNFLIGTGSGIVSLKDRALKAAARIGRVMVDMGGTACQVPDVKSYIAKIEEKGYLGRKRKTVKC